MFPENRFMELLIIGALALIIVGPKDLPILMRKVGQFVAKMRGMAAEFRASFDELARQSELEELRKEVEAMRIGQQTAISNINPLGDTSGTLSEINQHFMTPLNGPAVDGAAPPALEPVPIGDPAVPDVEPGATPAKSANPTPRKRAAKTVKAKSDAT